MSAAEPYIFMSHSSKNNAFTQRLTDDLQAAGFNVWVDLEALRDGDRWLKVLQGAIEGCSALVVVMSRAARESEWVERETLLALEWRKPIFIARLEDIPLPLQLITRQFTDFTGDYAAALARLQTALRGALHLPTAAASPLPETPYSPDPNEDNFFAYLAQMRAGAALAQTARALYAWADDQQAHSEFGGRMTPGLHVKIAVGGKLVTVVSLLAYLRHPGLQVPLDYLAKYPPYTAEAERAALLRRLNALLPSAAQVSDARATRRPTYPLVEFADPVALLGLQQIMAEVMMRLRAAAAEA